MLTYILAGITILTGVCALVGFGFSFFVRRSDVSAQKEIDGCMALLRTDVELLKKQMSLFWGIVEKEIGSMLHSPHREELDKLIERIARGERLGTNGLRRFTVLIDEILGDPDTTPGEHTGATLYKAAVLSRYPDIVADHISL